jgi:hypothetical protein
MGLVGAGNALTAGGKASGTAPEVTSLAVLRPLQRATDVGPIDPPKIGALADGRLDEDGRSLVEVGGLVGALGQRQLRVRNPLPRDKPAGRVE